MTQTDTSLYLLHALQFIITIFAVNERYSYPFHPSPAHGPAQLDLITTKLPAPTYSIHYTGDFFTALLTVAEHKD